MRDKPHLNFHVKNYQERHIRLNSQASTALQSVLVKRHPQSDFVLHKKDESRWSAIHDSFNALVRRCELGAGPPFNITLHTRRHTYDRSQLLTPWVYAVARYRLVDYLRRTKASIRDVPIEEATEVFADDDATAVDSGLDLVKLMAQLTPKARQAIQFVKLDGLSVSEAATRAGMSQSAIKVSVHRGLRALALLARERSQS